MSNSAVNINTRFSYEAADGQLILQRVQAGEQDPAFQPADFSQ